MSEIMCYVVLVVVVYRFLWEVLKQYAEVI